MRKPLRSILAVLTIMTCTGVVGCAIAPSRQAVEPDATIRQEDIKVTVEQTRLRMRSLVGPMCGDVEQSADVISDGTNDVNVKLAALKWKMQAVPALREALYRPDSYTAAVDTAILCYQMVDYFETGPGKQELGPASAEAAATCRKMADEFMKIVESGLVSGKASAGRAFVQKWAAEHPIRHSIADRESAMTRVFEQQFIAGRDATAYVADAAASVDDLNRKLDVFSDQLFRQARWEVERMELEVLRDLQGDETFKSANQMLKSASQAMATVDRLTPIVERSLGMAQDVPKMIATERETALKAVHDEITRTLAAVREERIIALEAVSKERATASKEISEALSMQASQLARDADLLATRKIDYTLDKATRLVAISLAIAIAVVAVVVVIWRWVVLSRQRRLSAGRIDTQLEA